MTRKVDAEALACPFCGQPPEIESTGHGHKPLYRCYLHTAGMRLEEWNKRAAPVAGEPDGGLTVEVMKAVAHGAGYGYAAGREGQNANSFSEEIKQEAARYAAALASRPAQGEALREAVRWFAGEMERQLRANDGKGGWEHCGRSWLAAQARTNLSEAERLTFKERDSVIKAAADAANFCMMIADNWRPGTPRQSASEAKKETIVHGVNCPKAEHKYPPGGYLHGELDDSPFDDDGVKYCGRCHHFLTREVEKPGGEG